MTVEEEEFVCNVTFCFLKISQQIVAGIRLSPGSASNFPLA